MTRVLHAMAGAEFGGAEAFFTRLVIALHKAGLKQTAVIRTHAKRAAQLRGAGVETVELPFGGAFDFKTKKSFQKEIDRFKPDVVLTWMNRATDLCPPGDFVHAARLGGYYNLKYYEGCDHLIGNTEDIVEYLRNEGWPTDKVHYLPNFVSETTAPPLRRKDFYTPDNVPLILGLGRLHENKAFDVLLKAVARLPNAYLWLAGDGPLRTELELLAEKLGMKPRVRFLGWRDDVAALFATADIFVCPSRHEPLGNVVLEAWAQGKPVVATDSLGPGTLIETEVNGLLVPVDNDTALYQSIRWLVEEPAFASRLAEAGHHAFQDGFTEAAVVARYLEFFARIAEKS